MVEIIWKEPPPAVSSEVAPILGALKNNPGRWALVRQKVTSSSAGAPWKKQGCEARVHRTNPREKPARYDVYARWPETKAQPPAGSKPLPLPLGKAAVEKAIATGTALKPPAPAPTPKAEEPQEPVAEDPGLSKYLESRRARVR
jgi:hypothetical protein